MTKFDEVFGGGNTTTRNNGQLSDRILFTHFVGFKGHQIFRFSANNNGKFCHICHILVLQYISLVPVNKSI